MRKNKICTTHFCIYFCRNGMWQQRWSSCCHQMNVFWVAPVLTTGCPVLSDVWQLSSREERVFDLLRKGTLFLHLTRSLGRFQQRVVPFHRFQQRVAPFYHDLGLKLVGSIGNFWIVAQLVHLVVEHLLNPNSLFQSCFQGEILWRGGRGDACTLSYMTSPVSILPTFGIQ